MSVDCRERDHYKVALERRKEVAVPLQSEVIFKADPDSDSVNTCAIVKFTSYFSHFTIVKTVAGDPQLKR